MPNRAGKSGSVTAPVIFARRSWLLGSVPLGQSFPRLPRGAYSYAKASTASLRPASYSVRALLLEQFPTLSVLITPGWIVRAGFIAIAGGMVGALYPAWLAGRKDAVEALAYE